MVVTIVHNKLEYDRYTSKIVESDLMIEFMKPLTAFRLLWVNLSEAKVVFSGARVVDLYTFNAFKRKVKEILILQHAENENRTRFSVKFLWANRVKVTYWALSIAIINAIMLFKKERISKSTKINIYYWLQSYRKRWEEYVKQEVNAVLCPAPNPLIYGCVKPIQIDEIVVGYFLVDEPLSKTLGITPEEEVELIKGLIKKYKITELFVKLHPRSSASKYDDIPEIIITETVLIKAKNVCGYKSGLLAAPYQSDSRILYDVNTDCWVETSVDRNVEGKHYVKVVKANEEYTIQ